MSRTSDLHVAAANNDAASIASLLQRPRFAGGNDLDYEGKTALHVAAAHGHVEAVLALCSASAKRLVNVNAVNRHGETPLDVARSAGAKHVLIEHGGESRRDNSSPVRRSSKREQGDAVASAPPALPPLTPRTQGGSSASFSPASEDPTTASPAPDFAQKVNQALLRKAVVGFLIPFIFLVVVNGLQFAGCFVVGASVFYLVLLSYFVSEISIRPPWYCHDPKSQCLSRQGLPDYWGKATHDPMQDFGIPFEEVSFPSTDGYTLRGWYVPRPKTSANHEPDIGVVCVHGGGRDRRAWLLHLPMFHQHGFSCLLFDFREHGLSDGAARGLTYGMRERFDVVSAVTFMREQKGHGRVAAVGTSVGGASVLMAAAIDPNICAVIAENPPMSCAQLQDDQLVKLIGGYFRHTRYSEAIFRAFRRASSMWLNWKVGNKPSRHCQAVHCVSRISPRPILLMHGTQDEIIPVYHSERIFEAAREPKELWICEGAFHCMLHEVEPAKYEQVVIGFLLRLKLDF